MIITSGDKVDAIVIMDTKITSKELIANYPIKTITLYYKQPLFTKNLNDECYT